MAENWGSWRRSNGLPRPGNSSVPSWEKKFCTSVCSIPWWKICAAKNDISLFQNIVDWDDSGALEAFENAKSRYWAETNGLHTGIPLPDPDMYIDEVDYNAIVDPELMADLHKKPPPPPCDENKDKDLHADLPIKPTGWDGDECDKKEGVSMWDTFIEKPLQDNGWCNGGWGNVDGWGKVDQHTNGNSSNCWSKNMSWGNNNSWAKQREYSSWGRHWDNWNNNEQHGGRNGRKINEFGPRSLKPRHQVNSYQSNNTYEKGTHVGKLMAMGQWRPKHSCGLMNRRPAEAAWHWEKSVT